MANDDQTVKPSRRRARKTGRSAPHAIVGIGVCAASLRSLQELVGELSPEIGAAYVIAVRQREGLSVADVLEALAGQTALEIKVASDGERMDANVIYVGGPDDLIAITDGHLRTRSASGPVAQRGTIDTMLISLAEHDHDRSVAVLMAGLGSDGGAGITATKKFGGLSIGEAVAGEDDGASAVSSGPLGVVDVLAPVADIAQHIERYIGSLDDVGEAGGGELPEQYAEQIAQIATILRKVTGNDFHGYKRNTFFRRVQRRMQVLQVGTVDDYVARLRDDREEVQSLFQDLLIGVTQFFRDPQEFEALEREVPRLFEGKGPDDQVRVWVLGCATGEEAYSLGILLREHLATLDAPPQVQIFATDLDAQALGLARAGRYADTIANHVSPERLARWFVKEGETYCVVKELREMCIFSPHNVVKDAPFSRIDLLSCRNLLIYLNADLQNRVIPIFHFSLRSGGVLFLGSSENVTRHQKLFAAVDRKNRIFRRLDTATRVLPDFPLSPRVRASDRSEVAVAPAPKPAPLTNKVSRRAEAIAERYAPAYVVIDREGEILHFSGRTGRYLEPIAGAATLSLLSLVHRDLRLDLRSALHRASRERVQVDLATLPLHRDGQTFGVNIVVEPAGSEDHDPFIVLFQDAGPIDGSGQVDGERLVSDEHVQRLEAELRLTKERLQATIEELESTNEELKSSNEEYQSINEELQSANEELETSKEELQSVNEELQTVNGELAHRVTELARSNSDLKNLLESTQIATVFLDNDLRVRNFTPTATDIFYLLDTDVGRPIEHVASRVVYPELADDVRKVTKLLAPVEREISSPDDRHFVVRVLPYRSVDNFIAGAVVTFVEVTVAVRAQALQRTLLAELQHRVRNILGVIRSIVRRTHEEGQSAEEFLQHLEGRLGALARTQVLLTRGVDAGVDLEALVRDELVAHAAPEERVHLSGPEVKLPPKAAEVLTLAVHELTTNSVKYGALLRGDAKIDIEWSITKVTDGRRLKLQWREDGVPIAQATPRRRGFGTELITQRVAYELQGTGKLELLPGGVVCTLEFPLMDRSSILQTSVREAAYDTGSTPPRSRRGAGTGGGGRILSRGRAEGTDRRRQRFSPGPLLARSGRRTRDGPRGA